MRLKINNLYLAVLLYALAVIFLLPNFASAGVASGLIDSIFKYAWGENIGWINFGAGTGNVRVTDSGLSGYAWSDNYGWINLNPPTAGVTNDGYGDLAGYAWGENLGWVDFNDVAINSSGEFIGYAVIENNSSRVNFNCSNTAACAASDFKVITDWRPRDIRPACNNSLDDDGDGRIDFPSDPGCLDLTDDNEVDSGSVIIVRPAGRSSPAPAQISAPGITPLAEKIEPEAEAPKPPAEVKKQPAANLPSAQSLEPKSVVKEISPLEQVLSKLKQIFGPILNKLARLKPITPLEIPLEKIVPRLAPLALRGQWQIMPVEPIDRFVLAPLPAELLKLAKKFPSLNKIFEQISISKITDISRLNNVALTLPGLTQAVNMPDSGLTAGKFTILDGLPLASLTAEIKQNLPSEIVFAKSGGEIIDYNIDLTINEQGRPQQKITALANQSLKLVVKPDGQVNGIKGYLVFKSADSQSTSRLNAEGFNWLIKPALAETPGIESASEQRSIAGRLQDFLSSLIFARPSLAFPQEVPVPVEEKLVLEEFDYTDGDGDGLWTAEIKTPAVAGQYEVITVLYYDDPEMGARAIKLTTVVDPEGYIYENYKDKELRVSGAIVYLYWLNPESKQYQIWPSENYNQGNPRITDISGKYSFLVPSGFYYLKIEAPGYLVYEGKPFQVKAGGGVHTDIELKTKYGWLNSFDWKTILLILVAMFLIYNFYKDKFRARKN